MVEPGERIVARRALVASGLVLAVLAMGASAWSRVAASNDRGWVPEQARTPVARFEGDSVVIENVRDFDWTGAGDPVVRWERRSYDLDAVESVWYILTPFARERRGPAHAFLSFGFADGRFLAVSVEARKEVGETYSVLKGLLKRFELMYVVGDERDLIGLRVLRADDDVYVYPIRATPDAARDLLVDMLEEATALAQRPVFYGSLRNNCTTRVLRHVNRVAPEPIPYGWRILLPGYSDAVAHERGLIDTDLPLDPARQRFRVNDSVRAHIDAPDFSQRIRQPASTEPS